MIGERDVFFEQAPFVELIAEVKWALRQQVNVPDGVDPFYREFEEGFIENAKNNGHPYIELLMPEEIPVELLAHQVRKRVRPAENKWPLYQIGPGIFSANWVPPYPGWSSFKEHLSSGIRALLSEYPLSSKYLRVSQMRLHYINAFPLSGQNVATSDFLEENFAVTFDVPQKVLDIFRSGKAGLNPVLHLNGSSDRQPDSKLSIQLARGSANETPAMILQTICYQEKTLIGASRNDMMEWFDNAHADLHDTFIAILTEDALSQIGPKRAVK